VLILDQDVSYSSILALAAHHGKSADIIHFKFCRTSLFIERLKRTPTNTILKGDFSTKNQKANNYLFSRLIDRVSSQSVT
jgi:hypothetical protein